ncbi:nuclear transport factor 2 family protein [Kribbella jejuensis]|uniref:Ketosteroid isomerase-like protein n=1 Tax=Kribbella jejuensis TaxID=236068 RepID=A0A542EUG0_9ACTN|nr:nuclear transport factor 2 family protein [Kribbella jejuensis]TQJ19002.1 ketosteroid isomerase-like protein [Kribbella jejuensis]
MRTPAEVLDLRRQYLIARDYESFAELFAEDGVIELPFAVDGLPARLEGREAIRDFSLKTSDRPIEILDLQTVQLHQTADPEVVVLELVTKGRHTTTNQPFEAPCIQVFRIRNGQIKHFRDYVAAGKIPGLT